ncbi:MAG TPA: hypothetical protein VMM60_17625 [Ilumatobacter sp.]|nr:hypothetical protein [Ilumatobacter sp.]
MAKSSSSSTNKAAKLAQHGTSRAVRFQGGTVFPLAIAITLVLGLALIVYARQSQPAADATPPTIDDHWHATYGFYLCDQWYELTGALEETNSQGNLVNTRYLASGVHSHDDGLIHWHPFSSVSVGKRAKIGVFFRSYGVEMSNDELKFPDANIPPTGIQEYIEGETKCGTEDAELSIKVWDLFTDTDSEGTYIANFNEIPLKNDGMVFGIYFTPKDADRPKPPKADQQPALGALDAGPGSNIPIGATTVPGPVVSLPGSDSSTPANTTDTTDTSDDTTESTEPTATTSPTAETTATTSG